MYIYFYVVRGGSSTADSYNWDFWAKSYMLLYYQISFQKYMNIQYRQYCLEYPSSPQNVMFYILFYFLEMTDFKKWCVVVEVLWTSVEEHLMPTVGIIYWCCTDTSGLLCVGQIDWDVVISCLVRIAYLNPFGFNGLHWLVITIIWNICGIWQRIIEIVRRIFFILECVQSYWFTFHHSYFE